jgi:hypothetical protein
VIVALLAALLVGLVAREWAYQHTSPIRYELNQRNAFYWGDRIVHPTGAPTRAGPAPWGEFWRSYVAIYEENEAHPAPAINTLDYVPLRLLMAGAWVNYLNLAYGPVSEWRPEFARSFAAFSMVMELFGAAAMFALVGRWLSRTSVDGPDPWRAAAGAAILTWLNPASIIDSHVWPHGQTWVLPFYLASVLALLERRWFLAGAIFGLGAMFKGQMLLVAPVMILWPMFDRRFGEALLVVLGMACGIGAVVWPWVSHGSFAWVHASFGAAGVYSDVLRKGTALNLPALLEKTCGATLHQHIVNTSMAGMHLKLELRTLLQIVYAALMVCCTWGISRQARLGERRLLVSIAAPWALMFFILAQMDERYLVWSACFTAAAIAVGRGRLPILAHAALTFAGAATMLEFLLIEAPATATSPAAHLLIKLNPLAWLMTGGAVTYLCVGSLQSSRRPRAIADTPAAQATGAALVPVAVAVD